MAEFNCSFTHITNLEAQLYHKSPIISTHAVCIQYSTHTPVYKEHLVLEAQIIIKKGKGVIIHSVYISYRTEDNRDVYKNVQEHTAALSESLQQSGTDQRLLHRSQLVFSIIHKISSFDTSFQLNILRQKSRKSAR